MCHKHRPGRQDERASSRRIGERHLRREGSSAHALGARLQFVAEAGPGDFIFVPPYVPHQEINADPSQALECVLVRSDNEAVVVNIIDVENVKKSEEVYWVDPIHRQP